MTTCARWRACVRISCAHVLRTLAPNGSVWGGLGAELFISLPECGLTTMSHRSANFRFHRSPSHAVCVHTCATRVCMRVPSNKARDAGVHELFIKNHSTSQLKCMCGQMCADSKPRAAERASVCASAAHTPHAPPQ